MKNAYFIYQATLICPNKNKISYFAFVLFFFCRTIHRIITTKPITIGSKATGIIHVRLADFLSERKGWFYKESTTTGIIHVRLADFLPERKGWFYKESTTTGIKHVRLAAFLSQRKGWFYKKVQPQA